MAAMSFYGYLIFLTLKCVRNKKTRIIITSLLSILVILIGISRIYLGVHYASDVLAGFLISMSYLIIYVTLTEKRIMKKGDVKI